MHLDTLDTTLVSRQMLTPDTAQLVLHAPDHTFDFSPGQHVGVAYESDDGLVHRSYSPVSLPETDTLALMVTRYDDGTCSVWLHEREVGDTVSLTDPSGNLSLQDPARDAVFLATGTGLTPMLSMLQQYLDVGSGDVTLVYGERTLDDVPYRDMLDLLAASHESLSVTYSLSDADAELERADEKGTTRIRRGYVQSQLDGLLDAGTIESAHVYVCGVPEMVVQTEDTLTTDLGIDEGRIFREGWEAGAVDAQ